ALRPFGRQPTGLSISYTISHPCGAHGIPSDLRFGSSDVASEAEILEEARKVRRLQLVVGLVMNVISQDDGLRLEEASELVAATRKYALSLFPDKEQTYD